MKDSRWAILDSIKISFSFCNVDNFKSNRKIKIYNRQPGRSRGVPLVFNNLLNSLAIFKQYLLIILLNCKLKQNKTNLSLL